MRSYRAVLGTLVSAVLLVPALAACGSDAEDTSKQATSDDCVETYEEGVDYFPDHLELEDAEGFSIEYHDHYQVLTVEQPFQGANPESYVLVKCGTPDPELSGELADAQLVTVPVQSIYSDSTTHLPAIISLGQLDSLTGVSEGAFVSSGEVINKIDDGSVVEYAKGGAIDTELVVGEGPDVLVTGGAEAAEYAKLRDSGVPVVANTEWLEATPLARAEWIKFFAAFTGTEAKATEVYAEIKQQYTDVAALAADAEPVSVLPGADYQGTWYMPAGGSYVGSLILDAGGTYPWADNLSGGSLTLDLEEVIDKAADIEIWLINDTSVMAVANLLDAEDRYSNLAAVEGQVWNATKALGPSGGNDYWESGVQRPDLILSDLVKIMHPDLLPDHEFVYYQLLPQN